MDTTHCTTSRRGFLKTVAVGAGSYAFGSMLFQPRDVFAQATQSPLDKIPMDARWEISSFGMVSMLVGYLKTLLDKEGRDKFEERVKHEIFAAGSRGKGIADRLGLQGSDAQSAAVMATTVIPVFCGPSQKFEILEASPEKARVRCSQCAIWNIIQASKIGDDICSGYSRAYWGGFCSAVNPQLTSELVQARPLGDSTCEWLITLKT